jgi:type II secretory pathway component GspD/PulD (secretin)
MQEEIAVAEREWDQVQRERAALDRGRADGERRRREQAARGSAELMARRQELRERIGGAERELRELEERGRGNTDESHERRQVLEQLLAEMESLEVHARSRTEGPMAPRAERRGEARGRVITKIFRLEHAHPEQMAAILHDLAGSDSRVLPDERTGSLIVSSTPEGQEQLERIIRELDVPGEDRGHARPEGGRALENEVEELRGQVRGLHDQMQQMREMLQRLVERSQNEEPGDRL